MSASGGTAGAASPSATSAPGEGAPFSTSGATGRFSGRPAPYHASSMSPPPPVGAEARSEASSPAAAPSQNQMALAGGGHLPVVGPQQHPNLPFHPVSPQQPGVVRGMPSQYVKLNVGGTLFYTTLGTLTKHDNMLRAMFSGRMEVLSDAEGMS